MIPEPSSKSLTRESFPSEADWIDPLLRAVNGIADSLAAAVAALNSQAAVVFVDLDIPGTYANAFPKLVANPLKTKAIHAYATAVIKRADPSATATSESRACFVEWENTTTSDGARQLRIKNVSGLVASTNYRITLKVEA